MTTEMLLNLFGARRGGFVDQELISWRRSSGGRERGLPDPYCSFSFAGVLSARIVPAEIIRRRSDRASLSSRKCVVRSSVFPLFIVLNQSHSAQRFDG